MKKKISLGIEPLFGFLKLSLTVNGDFFLSNSIIINRKPFNFF